VRDLRLYNEQYLSCMEAVGCLLVQMKTQQRVVVGSEQSDPVIWLDRLSAIYESVALASLTPRTCHGLCRSASRVLTATGHLGSRKL